MVTGRSSVRRGRMEGPAARTNCLYVKWRCDDGDGDNNKHNNLLFRVHYQPSYFSTSKAAIVIEIS